MLTKLFDSLYPPDSGIAVYFRRDVNLWLDEDGVEHFDLKDFGFTALQRETILAHIQDHLKDEYVSVHNNNVELVEIYWEYREQYDYV